MIVVNIFFFIQVAGLLQAWLRELPEPLVQSDLYDEVLHSQQCQDKAQRMSNLHNVLKKVQCSLLQTCLNKLVLFKCWCPAVD